MIGFLFVNLDSKLAPILRVLKKKIETCSWTTKRWPPLFPRGNKIGVRLVSRDACYFERATSHLFDFHKRTRAVRFRGWPRFGTCPFIIRKRAESSFSLTVLCPSKERKFNKTIGCLRSRLAVSNVLWYRTVSCHDFYCLRSYQGNLPLVRDFIR